MKVIGETGSGFLVEATAEELARAAGYGSCYSTQWRELPGIGSGGRPNIGTTINTASAYTFHARIASEQQKAREAAATLRALASLLDGALPDVVLAPAEQNNT